MNKNVLKLVPQLRFSEFTGDWEIKKLGELLTIRYGKDHKDLEDGEYPVLGTGGVMRYVNSYLYDKPSILIGRKGTIDKPKFVTFPFWTVDTLFYTEINSNIIPFFLFLIVQSINWQRYNEATGVPSLNTPSINNIKVRIVSDKKEQEKIASFLDSVTLRITQLRRQHELLETYKKGVMQKIFSQEIRFKQDDGKPFPDWEYKKLRTISKPIKRQLESGEAIVMSISSGSGFVDQKERFNQVIAGSSLKKYTLIKKYEFAYNRGASKAFPFGCIYMMEEEDEALIPFVYRTFRLTEGTPYFFAQYFLTGYLDRQLRKMISSSARMDGLLNIGEKDFFIIKIPFPVNEEQEKIANFLSSIDKKIEAVSLQIEKMEEFKQGLLQKMFV